ncbi:2TM domain-containing protein [Flavobacterium sp.]|uniref:2TM domain-containing protein n=1 Tax=Flavobacterium sp. TaxID=239 RepID=UPI00260FAF0D|nr:2TM domain-containing protein [Flavobacterium sp.]
MENLDEIRYQEALRRVKKVKGFYTHLIVFVVVNTAILIHKIKTLPPGESYFQMEVFSVLVFWGIGLLSHALSIFLPTVLLGKDWEEKKIKELMDRDKNNQWE